MHETLRSYRFMRIALRRGDRIPRLCDIRDGLAEELAGADLFDLIGDLCGGLAGGLNLDLTRRAQRGGLIDSLTERLNQGLVDDAVCGREGSGGDFRRRTRQLSAD
jgi:hypothetical protein